MKLLKNKSLLGKILLSTVLLTSSQHLVLNTMFGGEVHAVDKNKDKNKNQKKPNPLAEQGEALVRVLNGSTDVKDANAVKGFDLKKLIDAGYGNKIANAIRNFNVDENDKTYQYIRDIIGGNKLDEIIRLYSYIEEQGEKGGSVLTPIDSSNGLTLSGRHGASDLFASIIFSKGKENDAADSINLSLNEIMRYPSDEDESQAYGLLKAPYYGAKNTEVGKETANRIKGLYNNEWLVVVPKTTNSSVGSTWFKYFFGEGNGTSSFYLKTLLSGASIGAAIFDAGQAILDVVFDNFMTFNEARLFFDDETLRTVYNYQDKDKTMFIDFLNKILKVLELELNEQVVKNLQNIGILSFAILLIAVTVQVFMMKKHNFKHGYSAIIRYSIRFFTIIATPFVFLGITQMVNLAVSEAGKSNDVVYQTTENVIFDTLTWAVTTNMSFSSTNNSALPTPENIGKLNEKARIIASKAGINDDLDVGAVGLDPKAPKEEIEKNKKRLTARALLSKVTDKETADVNDYVNLINSANAKSVAISASISPGINKPITSWIGDERKYSKNQTNEGSPTTTLMYPAMISYDEDREDSEGSEAPAPPKEDKAKDKDKKEEVKVETVEEDEVPKTIEGWAKKLKPDDPTVIRQYDWRDLTTYIFGAKPAPSLTKTTKSLSTYVNGLDSQLQMNPEDGDLVSKKGTDDVDLLMKRNALSMAILNRYSGMSRINNSISFSTQSVVFLLQTSYDSGTLEYRGVNTVSSKEGASKNVGIGGNTFVRFVIPNTGLSDLVSKASLLSAQLIVAGLLTLGTVWYIVISPILLAYFRIIKGFVLGLCTGNPVYVLEGVVYKLALGVTRFVTVFAITATMKVTENLLNILQPYAIGLSVPFLGYAISIVLAVGIAYIYLYPAFSLKLGKRSVKVGVLGVAVTAPMLLALACDEYFDKLHFYIFGTGKRSTLLHKIGGHIDTSDMSVKNAVGGVGKAVGTVGKAGALVAGGVAGSYVGRKLAQVSSQKLATQGSKIGGAVSNGLATAGNRLVRKVDGKETGLRKGLTSMTNTVAQKMVDTGERMKDASSHVYEKTRQEDVQQNIQQSVNKQGRNTENKAKSFVNRGMSRFGDISLKDGGLPNVDNKFRSSTGESLKVNSKQAVNDEFESKLEKNGLAGRVDYSQMNAKQRETVNNILDRNEERLDYRNKLVDNKDVVSKVVSRYEKDNKVMDDKKLENLNMKRDITNDVKLLNDEKVKLEKALGVATKSGHAKKRDAINDRLHTINDNVSKKSNTIKAIDEQNKEIDSRKRINDLSIAEGKKRIEEYENKVKVVDKVVNDELTRLAKSAVVQNAIVVKEQPTNQPQYKPVGDKEKPKRKETSNSNGNNQTIDRQVIKQQVIEGSQNVRGQQNVDNAQERRSSNNKRESIVDKKLSDNIESIKDAIHKKTNTGGLISAASALAKLGVDVVTGSDLVDDQYRANKAYKEGRSAEEVRKMIKNQNQKDAQQDEKRSKESMRKLERRLDVDDLAEAFTSGR